MGFTKPNFPAVEPETFLQKPLIERMKTLALNWVVHRSSVSTFPAPVGRRIHFCPMDFRIPRGCSGGCSTN
jgi:hypothetical protein